MSAVDEASTWFMAQLVALEPRTESGGIYANKPGYHNSRLANKPTDYSVQLPADKQGPADKAAGYDWTFLDAQNGDYRSMAKYGDRLEAAFYARDPRLAGWREALGQMDTDRPPEAMDFQGWYLRVPDDTHIWHWHFSEMRKFISDYRNKRALLSILRGETLEKWMKDEGLIKEEIVGKAVMFQGSDGKWYAGDGLTRREIRPEDRNDYVLLAKEGVLSFYTASKNGGPEGCWPDEGFYPDFFGVLVKPGHDLEAIVAAVRAVVEESVDIDVDAEDVATRVLSKLGQKLTQVAVPGVS